MCARPLSSSPPPVVSYSIGSFDDDTGEPISDYMRSTNCMIIIIILIDLVLCLVCTAPLIFTPPCCIYPIGSFDDDTGEPVSDYMRSPNCMIIIIILIDLVLCLVCTAFLIFTPPCCIYPIGSFDDDTGEPISDYMRSTNCMIELRAAARMNKPLIIMLETDRSHGGVPLSVHYIDRSI